MEEVDGEGVASQKGQFPEGEGRDIREGEFPLPSWVEEVPREDPEKHHPKPGKEGEVVEGGESWRPKAKEKEERERENPQREEVSGYDAS